MSPDVESYLEVLDREPQIEVAELGEPVMEKVDGRRFNRPVNVGQPPKEVKPYDGYKEGELFNALDVPDYILKHYKSEKPEHRIIAYLLAQGCSTTEVAERTGYSRSAIVQIRRLPWVQACVLEEIRRRGADEVREVLQSDAINNILFLQEARDDDKAQLRDRITASKELLDRTFGKAALTVTHRQEVDLNKLSDQELAALAMKQATVDV